MKNNPEIESIISCSKSKNTTFQKPKEESIIDETKNEINNFKLDELKLKISQNGNSEKINETEKVEENSNVINNSTKIEKEDSQKESKDNIQKGENSLKNENIQANDIKQSINEVPQSNLESNQKKEDNQQSEQNNHIMMNENEAKKNSNESDRLNTIDDNAQYKTIEKIMEENQIKNNNIQNNNQIYFTEANILVDKSQEDIHKSDSNNLYQLTSIPENSNSKKIQYLKLLIEQKIIKIYWIIYLQINI